MQTALTARLKLAVRVLLVIGLPAYFSIAGNHFLSPPNLYALMQSFAYLGIVALGLSVTMIAGEFDLSVAATATVAGLVTIKMGDSSAVLGLSCAITFGVAVGLANSVLLPWLQVSSLVTTVGSMIFLTGVGFWIAGGRILSYDGFEAGDFLDQKLIWIASPRFLITFLCYLAVSVFLSHTTLGRDIYAAGGNRKAALQSGARVTAALTTCFVISGAFAALGGGLMSLSLASAAASLNGDVLLQAASAAIVGGVALSGGVGTPLGVAAGVLILSMLNNGLGLMSATSTQVLLLNGLLLLIVVLLDGRLGGALARRHRIAKPACTIGRWVDETDP